jgi:hypothetical protein
MPSQQDLSERVSETPYVNVRPKTQFARDNIRHPARNLGFSDNPAGTSWPDDQFTQRRVQDGDIEIVAPPDDTNG